jgi:alanine dehydrogenase
MSEVAGRMATQVGVRFLEKPQGGKGKLMGGVPGVRPAISGVVGPSGIFSTGEGCNIRFEPNTSVLASPFLKFKSSI